VERCSELINQYRLGQNGKVSTVLSIREILVDSLAVRSGRDINDALDVFIGMLDGIDSSKRTASERAQQSEGRMPEEEAERENRGSSDAEESEAGSKRTRDESVSEGDEQPLSKRGKTVGVSKFPWMQRRTEALATLPSDIRETYEQLENFAADPKNVVTNILSTPGCPPFPPSEWLNIVWWKYVDLGKVLDSAHTTELDPKKTHVIDDEIELALQVSKSSGGIKTSSDHNIAFSMYTEAIAFVFPQRRNEYVQYHTYLSWLFHAMEVRLHSRVIEFDRSIRNQVAMQRNLRLTDHSEFEHLRTTFLTSFGIGSNSTSSTSGSRGRTNRREGNSGRDDPCHKWNRGTCSKSDSECRFAHCCDWRGCRGAHRKSEC
ncbi:hypothetical protein DFH29DRAFT_784351, partial [Suillus ampliporus]